MFFLAFSNTYILFGAERFTWRSYTDIQILPTTKRVELIDKPEFAKVALDKNSEMFFVHVAIFEAPKPAISIFPSRVPVLAGLQHNMSLTKIILKYVDYTDVFNLDSAM